MLHLGEYPKNNADFYSSQTRRRRGAGKERARRQLTKRRT